MKNKIKNLLRLESINKLSKYPEVPIVIDTGTRSVMKIEVQPSERVKSIIQSQYPEAAQYSFWEDGLHYKIPFEIEKVVFLRGNYEANAFIIGNLEVEELVEVSKMLSGHYVVFKAIFED